MKPQTASYLAAADKALVEPSGVLAINFSEQAARLAYYAEFHAAQALIFERTTKVAKTHKGVRKLFYSLAQSESGMDTQLAGHLDNDYQFKQIADYETGSGAVVSREEASAAIARAEHFVANVKQVLAR